MIDEKARIELIKHQGELLKEVEGRLDAAMDLVNSQAEDEALWFDALTAPEAYLQQELRKLHAVIEGLG